jgi:transcriptional regulator
MYIPKHFVMTDFNKAIDFIKTYNFGILVSHFENKPIATHLPFLLEKRAEKWFLITHIAKSNEQNKNLEDQTILAIFSEPHAYISPRLYSEKQNVPTWNYVSVHCYGNAILITNKDEKIKLLENLISLMDPNYTAQWETLPERYKNALLDDMLGIEIEITHFDAKEKLSQNKPAIDQQKIIDHLENSGDTIKQDLANKMKIMIKK